MKRKASTQKPSTTPVDCIDGLQECVLTVRALAGLLEVSGHHPQAELLQPDMVSRAGYLILSEMRKAEVLLEQLDEVQREAAR